MAMSPAPNCPGYCVPVPPFHFVRSLQLVTGAVLVNVYVAASAVAFDWTDYTDFGKGFYVHLEENKAMAYEWAKRRFVSDWAVVEFVTTLWVRNVVLQRGVSVLPGTTV